MPKRRAGSSPVPGTKRPSLLNPKGQPTRLDSLSAVQLRCDNSVLRKKFSNPRFHQVDETCAIRDEDQDNQSWKQSIVWFGEEFYSTYEKNHGTDQQT
jgi:hypothetical protein